MKYRVVGPEHRRPRKGGAGRPLGKASLELLSGKTLFFPGATHQEITPFRVIARLHGHIPHQRTTTIADTKGIVIWVEDVKEGG